MERLGHDLPQHRLAHDRKLARPPEAVARRLGTASTPTSRKLSRALRDQYFDDRAFDVELIYTTLDPAEAQLILYKYDIDYVYIGRREREKYGIEGIPKFDAIADLVFTDPNAESAIYRVR